MIQDVDESLRVLVRRDALNGGGVDIAFDAPTRDWSARRNAPTLDLYLYDVREDLVRREVMWDEVRDTHGRVTERRPPARHYKLSYLVTAWTQRPEDEHRLLSAVLACFVRHEMIPPDVLAGSLAGSELPVYMTIALPPPTDRSLSDVWSALGGELKPSLDLVVSAPLAVRRHEVAGPPVREEPRIRVGRPDAETEVAGGAGAAGAVGAGGTAGRRARRAGDAAAVPEAEETIHSGTESRPGRIVRVRTRERP
jgi:Pvc16 N-terminal domain